MGLYEKFLGNLLIPSLYILLCLLAIGIFRRQVHYIINLTLKLKVEIEGRIIYVLPIISLVNAICIVFLYLELAEMKEPAEFAGKAIYFEKLYRTYRNFLLNTTSAVLIL